jgi:predicted PhzF superfamily epimerase YddE/YHI9
MTTITDQDMVAAGIPYTLVDAFATGPFTGNQAAVVVTQEPLSSEVMLKIAACVAFTPFPHSYANLP